VNQLVAALAERDIQVQKFELSTTDIGKLKIALFYAATIEIGTPTVHVGPHPSVFFATHLANALRPKLKYAAMIGSYAWGTKAVEQISGLIPNRKVEVLGAVLCRGLPRAADFSAWTIFPKRSGKGIPRYEEHRTALFSSSIPAPA